VRRYFVGYVSSNLGTAMAGIALAFAVLDSGGDATDLGLVLAAGIVVQVVLMVGGGVLADRLGRRRVMLGADVLRTLCQGLLAALLFVGHPAIWAFVVLAAARSVGDALFQPAFNGLIVDIAPPDEVVDANALFGTSQSASAVAGPALAGILVALGNPATVIALDAVSFAVSAIALAGLKLPTWKHDVGTSLVTELIEGWDTFRSRTWLWTITIQFALFNLVAWGPFLLLGPVLSKQDLSGARSWGSILAAYALGSVIGGLIVLGRRPSRPLLVATIGTFGYPIPLLLLALRASTAAIAGGALIAGAGSATFNIFFSATIQRHIPADAQARVSAFDAVGAYSAGPIAFAAAGPVAELVGAHTVLAFGAAWALLSSLIVITLPAIRTTPWERTHDPSATSPAKAAPEADPGA
jgi:MFS family permease